MTHPRIRLAEGPPAPWQPLPVTARDAATDGDRATKCKKASQSVAFCSICRTDRHCRAWVVLVLLVLSGTGARAAAAPAVLRVVATAHYRIHTDVPDAALIADLGREMDIIYGQYGKQLSDFRPPADAPPLPVYLFAQRDRYTSFSRFAGANTGGIFVGGLHPFLASYVDGQTHDELRQALRHEGFHQFAYFAISRHLPVWLNEGLAQVFEEGIWTGQSFLLGQVTPRRILQLRSDRDRHTALSIQKLMAITPMGWADTLRRDANAGETNYNGAWAFAQYLTFGAKPDVRRRATDLLNKLHDLDQTGEASDTASAKAFHNCFPNLPQLQSAFTAWCADLRPTDEATLLDRQLTLGDFLMDYRNVGQTFPDVPTFRATAQRQHLRVTYVRGLVRRTTDADVRVYFSDLTGLLYGPQQLYFEPVDGGPLPDIVCHATAGFRVRTHFYRDDHGSLGHEGSVEPVESP